jgi:hypothetical protein
MMEKLEHGKKAKELIRVVVKLLRAYINYVYTITGENGNKTDS